MKLEEVKRDNQIAIPREREMAKVAARDQKKKNNEEWHNEEWQNKRFKRSKAGFEQHQGGKRSLSSEPYGSDFLHDNV